MSQRVICIPSKQKPATLTAPLCGHGLQYNQASVRCIQARNLSIRRMPLLALLLCCFSFTAFAASSTTAIRRNAHVVVDAGGSQSSSPFNVALTNVAAGDLIVCEATIESGPQITSISDTSNGVYTQAVAMHTNTTLKQQSGIFFVPNATAGSHTISMAWTGGPQPWVAMACQSWTGVAITAPLDVNMTQQQDGASKTNASSGSVKTPAVAGELVIGNMISGAQIPTAGASYALTDVAASTYMWPEFLVESAATATNAPYINGTDNWTSQMAAFKPLVVAVAAPVISSATSASGTAGNSFSYQITATNTPTSYGASGLPAGLTLNSTTGLISGTPTAAGTSTVALSATNSGGTGTANLSLSIAAPAPVLSSFACTIASITGAGTDACTITLSSAALSGGFTASLSSNNSAVTVPASVSVPAGATSASFSASIASVSTAQSVTLSAAAGTVAKNFALQLNAAVPTLNVSTTSAVFGNIAVNSSSSQSITVSSTGTAAVTVNSATLTGTGFSVSGATFPLTLNPNQSATLTVTFNPISAGAVSGSLTIASNSSTNGTSIIALSGAGTPVLTGLSCSNASLTGTGTDACTVSLNTAAASGGFVVNLTSSGSAVSVPASVTVPTGATNAGFSATVNSVNAALAITLSANAGGVYANFPLQLNVATPTLTVDSSSINFGSVAVNASATQLLTLSSTGAAALTVNSATVSGAGFSVSGGTFPLTLNPGQAATLTIQFNPAAAGAASGSLTIASNSSTNGTSVIALSGTGAPVLTGLSCSRSSVTGAGTDTCTVSLNAAPASGGFAVNLASTSSAVTVPASVTVAAGASSASFTATVASVTIAQAVTLSASAGTTSQTFALQLNPVTASITRNAHVVVDAGGVLSSSPFNVTLSNVAAGDLIVCETTIEAGPQVSSVSDTSNGTYTQAIAMHTNTALQQQTGIFFVPNAVAGNHTISMTWTGGPQPWVAMACQSWTGAALTAPLDASMTQQLDGSSAINATSGTAKTPAAAGELVIGAMISGAQIQAAGQNYSLTDLASSTYMWPEYSVESATTATNTPYVNSADNWTNQMVAFRPLGSAVPAPVITSSTAASGTVGSSFSYQITATNTPSSYGVTGLPAGLSLNSASGLISGTVTAAGTSTITLSATNTGGSGTANLTLVITASTSTLSINATSIPFGTVNLNSPATQSVTLSSTGSAPVTISSAMVSGTGFSLSGASFPLTLNPNQTTALNVQFNPTTAGAASGQLIISSNSSVSPMATIGLSGTGTSTESYSVSVTWNAPSSASDPIAAYNIYRSPDGGSTYQLVGSVNSTQLAYMDSSNFQTGATYNYIVESVDASGNESVPSNVATIAIP